MVDVLGLFGKFGMLPLLIYLRQLNVLLGDAVDGVYIDGVVIVSLCYLDQLVRVYFP